ncbi:glycosyltransferase [Paucisalibacillus sp. EB02]|uniref:glycosyltransferase n=1 Tax=Paucisalibacillus sp. EB02 TaxID=1347087 RepID=UPI0004AD5D86|nr:glycosyltransferase [Paucisalibacillus sp. EB02]
MCKKLKVLLYGDVDLNFLDGSAVWLTSIANTLNYDQNINVDLLLKAKIKNKNLVSEIEDLDQINIIDTYNQFRKKKFNNGNRMNTTEAVQLMEELHSENNYDCIIIRGFELVKSILKSPSLVRITIPYITDFTHDENIITDREAKLLNSIYQHFPQIFVQTPQMGEAFKKVANVNGEKLNLLLPMIPDYNEVPEFKNRNSSLVYSGKFAQDWYTEEIIDAYKKIKKQDTNIKLNIAGDKFQGELIARKKDIIITLKGESGINWVGGVSRKASLEFIESSDIGVSWRSKAIDNNNSVELSTKLLEYGRLGKPILLRRTIMHEELLGKEYPLFVDTEEEFISKSIEVLNNRKLYRKSAKSVYESCKKFTFYEAYKRLKPVLWSFYTRKTNIVFVGHDLKFINTAIEFFEGNSDFEVKIDKWKGHNKHDEEYSKKCLEWADIIFCEWGLGNAVWYSNNKRKGQKLIVRMHAQERLTDYPSKFNLANIDKIIAISPFIFEEFFRLCKIPREKMTMIFNMVDTTKFDKPKYKDENIMFNLGICGILPKSKRIDKVLDIFERLWEKDNRYKLYIKSKLPKDLPWLMNREEEKEFFEKVFDRIESASWKKNVIFDKHGNDVEEWLKKIGFVLSTSDFESFHLAPMEGMASGSIPVVLKWPGSETIYPDEFLFNSKEDIVEFIYKNGKSNMYKDNNKLKELPKHSFDKHIIFKKILHLITSL